MISYEKLSSGIKTDVAISNPYAYLNDALHNKYIPIASELLIQPILGSAKILLGIAYVIAGIASIALGLLTCCWEFGETALRAGGSLFLIGLRSGLFSGLITVIPWFGTIHVLNRMSGKQVEELKRIETASHVFDSAEEI